MENLISQLDKHLDAERICKNLPNPHLVDAREMMVKGRWCGGVVGDVTELDEAIRDYDARTKEEEVQDGTSLPKLIKDARSSLENMGSELDTIRSAVWDLEQAIDEIAKKVGA